MLDCWNLKYTGSIRDILDVLFPLFLMDAKAFLEFHSISVVSFGSWWIFAWSLLCSVRGRLYPLAGLQPLHAAAIAGHSDVVQILVEHGADANSRHRFAGNSALQLGFIQAWRPKISTTTWNRKMTDLSTRRKYKRYRPFAPCAPFAYMYPSVHPFWLKLQWKRHHTPQFYQQAKPWYYKYYKTATIWRVFCCPWCVSQCTSPLLPRHFAAEMGHVEVVRRLCDLKADVEAEKTQGGRSQGGSIPGWTAFLWHSLIQKPAVVINGKERQQSLCVCVCVWKPGARKDARHSECYKYSMKWGIWGEEICSDMATFWISEFIDSDVDGWKVQLCTQLRTPTMRQWRRSFWRLFLHMKCHRYDVVEILMYVDTNGPWYTWEMWWGIALKVFGPRLKNSMRIWQGNLWCKSWSSATGWYRSTLPGSVLVSNVIRAMFGDFKSWRCQGFYCNCPDVWAVATNPTHVLW